MVSVKQWDVLAVLAVVDAKGTVEKRHVLVVSGEKLHATDRGYYVVALVDVNDGREAMDLEINKLKPTNLEGEHFIRVRELFVLPPDGVADRVGHLHGSDRGKVKRKLKEYLAL